VEDAESLETLLQITGHPLRMSIFEAAVEVASVLEQEQIPYAVLGGVALQHWGEPRTTQDVDIVVLVPSDEEEPFLKRVLSRFQPRIPDALSFAKRHRVLLIATAGAIPIDLSLGIPGYEEEVMRRASRISFAGLPPIRVVSPEDLIVHKCVAGRARDIEDIQRVLIRQQTDESRSAQEKFYQSFRPLRRPPEPEGAGGFLAFPPRPRRSGARS
jgi:predicted nucleotidyltransferase